MERLRTYPHDPLRRGSGPGLEVATLPAGGAEAYKEKEDRPAPTVGSWGFLAGSTASLTARDLTALSRRRAGSNFYKRRPAAAPAGRRETSAAGLALRADAGPARCGPWLEPWKRGDRLLARGRRLRGRRPGQPVRTWGPRDRAARRRAACCPSPGTFDVLPSAGFRDAERLRPFDLGPLTFTLAMSGWTRQTTGQRGQSSDLLARRARSVGPANWRPRPRGDSRNGNTRPGRRTTCRGPRT